MQNKTVSREIFSIEEIVSWAIRSGIKIDFDGVRTSHGQFLFQVVLSVRVGSRFNSVIIAEDSLSKALNRVKKEYQEIFVKLQCPPMVIKPRSPYEKED